MARQGWGANRRVCAALVAIVTGTLVGWLGAGFSAWAAEPTLRYISHRFPAMEFWAKKMGDYPGIKLEAELIPFDQALEKMQIHLSQKAPTYDIMAPDAFLPTFAERGWLLPLDPLIAKYRQAIEWDDVNQTLVREACSYKGKVYGIPNLSIVMFFFYRRDLFEAAGLKPPETMDEWIAAAKTLTRPDKKQYGTLLTLKAGDGLQNDFTYFLRTFGGDWYDKDWKVTIDSEAGFKALSTMKELMKYAPPNVLAFHNDEATVAMQQGLTAMGLQWQSRALSMDRAQVSQVVDKVAFAVPPAATKGGRSHPRLAVSCYAISAYTKNDPDLVFQTIAKTLNKPNMKEGAGLFTPTRVSVTSDPEVTQKFRFIRPAADTIQAGARLIPANPEFSEAMLPVTQNLQKGLSGELSVQEALKRAQKVMHDLMAEKGYYKK
ncbi:MAG TPA: extracellular solute-binding protein [Methylomirabilota bacterium]|jgi:ABC-type glycerol-3-phosphate transport system substrate-binding protein|nr:extracellular solute-binding protein [Methylomirabilota bacterium]